jgi:hypothetical protein
MVPTLNCAVSARTPVAEFLPPFCSKPIGLGSVTCTHRVLQHGGVLLGADVSFYKNRPEDDSFEVCFGARLDDVQLGAAAGLQVFEAGYSLKITKTAEGRSASGRFAVDACSP